MENDMSEGHTPSEHLASEVADALIEAGLLRADKRDGIATKIATGQMKAEDWRLEIDLAVEKAVQQ
jgi:hypothetical protein